MFTERGGNTGWLLVAAQRGRRVFSADTCALRIGSCTPGDLSDKAEVSTGTPPEPGLSTLPMPAKGGRAMGLSHCWQRVPRGGLGSLQCLFFGVQICPQQLMQGASRQLQRWQRGQHPNVTRQPRCHHPVAQRASYARSLAGATASFPGADPGDPGLRQGPPIKGFLERAQPRHLLHKHLHQHSGRSSAKPCCSRAPLALSHTGEISPESWWWPYKPHHPHDPSWHHLLLTPTLYKQDLAKSSPRHT